MALRSVSRASLLRTHPDHPPLPVAAATWKRPAALSDSSLAGHSAAAPTVSTCTEPYLKK